MNTPLSPHDVELLFTAREGLAARPDLAELRDLLDSLDTDLRPAEVKPSGDLLVLLVGGHPMPAAAAERVAPAVRPRLRLLGKVASAGLGVRLALGGAAAAAALVAAGMDSALPAPVQDIVDHVLKPSREPQQDSAPAPVPEPQLIERRTVLTPAPGPAPEGGGPGSAGGAAPDVDAEGDSASGTPASQPGPATTGATPTAPGQGGQGGTGDQGEDVDDTGEGHADDTGEDAAGEGVGEGAGEDDAGETDAGETDPGADGDAEGSEPTDPKDDGPED